VDLVAERPDSARAASLDDTCDDWTTTTSAVGRHGSAVSTLSSYWDGGTTTCAALNAYLYCVEQ